MTDVRTILYIAAAETAARDGAAALERVADVSSDLEFVVEAATDFETIRECAPGVDCVVFAETPTTAAGAHLLEVVDACQGTPLVLYTDGAYGATAARSTEGVDGYVRRGRVDDEDDDGLTYLVDEIAWVSHGRTRTQSARKALPDPGPGPGPDRDSDSEADTTPAADLLESLPEGVFTVDRRGRLTYANEWVGDLFDIDATSVRDVPLEALEAAGTLSTADLEALEDAIDRVVGGDEHVTAAATMTVTVTVDGTAIPLSLRVGARGSGNGSGSGDRGANENDTEAIVTVRPNDDRRPDTTATDSATPERTDSHERTATPDSAAVVASAGRQAVEAEGEVATDTDTETAGATDATDVTGPRTATEPHLETDDERDRPEHATITTVREAIDDIVAARDEAHLFERTLEAADAVLGIDRCWLLVAEDGRLVPAAESAGAPAALVESQSVTLAGRDTDEGSVDGRDESETSVAGRTFRTGEGAVFRNSESGRQHRSLLSVPIGDVGVFQAVADDTGTFDAGARERIELLARIVATVHTRIHAETVLDTERDYVSELFENVPDPVVHYEFVDGEPIVRDVNPPFETVFGYDRETILGENVDDYIVPSGLEDEAATLNEQLRRGENDQRESRRRTAAGIRDFLITCAPIESGDYDESGFAIYSNVTERKRRERELAAKNDRLEEFTSIVGHDLRNPLNVARGYLELASETGDEEHFSEVDAAHERMGTLLDQLLALARRGDVIADTEPVAIHDSARRAWNAVETDTAELVLERDDILEADRSRLTEVLENLIRNAIEHGCERETGADSDPDSDSDSDSRSDSDSDFASAFESDPGDGDADEEDHCVTIRIGATDDGFFVADDGVGIPSADRETVFDSGYTTAPDGTGYGLRIVEQIVEAHGWTVSVTDSIDGGARFDVRDVSETNFESIDSEAPFLETDADA